MFGEQYIQVPLFVSTKMTRMKTSLFVPTPDMYSKACTRFIGYEKLVVPYFFHSVQGFFMRTIPDALVDSYMLRYFLYWRGRGLSKDSKIKAIASNSWTKLHYSEYLTIIKSYSVPMITYLCKIMGVIMEGPNELINFPRLFLFLLLFLGTNLSVYRLPTYYYYY